MAWRLVMPKAKAKYDSKSETITNAGEEEEIEFEIGGAHALTRVGDVFYHFGGYSVLRGQRHSGSTMYYLPLTSEKNLQWHVRDAEGGNIFDFPSPRNLHAWTAVDHRIFLFGGFCGGSCENSLHIFDTRTFTWTKINPHRDDLEGEERGEDYLPAASKKYWPEPRAGTSAVLVGKKIYYFGGWSNQMGNSQELFTLDTETFEWELLNPDGIAPTARYNQICVEIGNKLVFMGGASLGILPIEACDDVHVYDIDANRWLPVRVEGKPSMPLAFHTASLLGSQILIMGGGALNSGNTEVDILDVTYLTDKVVWRKPLCSPSILAEVDLSVMEGSKITAPGTRFGHTTQIVDNKLWCFGGSIDYRGLSVTYGDIWAMHFLYRPRSLVELCLRVVQGQDQLLQGKVLPLELQEKLAAFHFSTHSTHIEIVCDQKEEEEMNTTFM